MVPRALPGELLRARVTAVKGSYADAARLETLEPHARAAPPPCPHFAECGGCPLQALQYEAQLDHKRAAAAELMARVGGVPRSDLDQIVRPAVGAPPARRLGYRNKLQFAFGSRVAAGGGGGGGGSGGEEGVPTAGGAAAEAGGGGGGGGGWALGFLKPGTSDVVVPISACLLQGAAGNAALSAARRAAAELGLAPPGAGAPPGRGMLRRLIIRSAPAPVPAVADNAVVIVTAECASDLIRPMAEAIAAAVPDVVSVVHSGGGGARGGARALRVARSAVLVGAPALEQSLCGLRFSVGPHSFFQTNGHMAGVLYDLVAEAVGQLPPGAPVLDLYTGTGTIALTLAKRLGGSVWGADVDARAIADATANAAANGVAGARFVCGDLDALAASGLPLFDGGGGKGAAGKGRGPGGTAAGGVIVVDPARAGLGRPVVEFLRRSGAGRVVYVSCNAATQARDVARLAGAYRLAALTPVDLFPQTEHVETVAVLERVAAP
ncbi:MAG: S-adenosyl-L-methionine-dependent methyltransferase [Monoraphidium minutum]|nr:MAG: S-adenosyl-L-methionine-dependent methyltransferase [Monoraphidium minutum]